MLPPVWSWGCFGAMLPPVQGWPLRDSEGSLVYPPLSWCPEVSSPMLEGLQLCIHSCENIPHCIYTVHFSLWNHFSNSKLRILLYLCAFHVHLWKLMQWLTGHSKGDLLCPATRLILSHTGVGAWVFSLGGAKHQIQAILEDSALCRYPLPSSLPPHLRLRSPKWGFTCDPL